MSGGNDDDFEQLQLDEEFIRSAARIEPSAEERIARAARIAHGHEQTSGWRQGTYDVPYAFTPVPPPRPRRRIRAITSLLLVIALCFAAIRLEEPIRGLLGRHVPTSAPAGSGTVDHVWRDVLPSGPQMPPVPTDAATTPLGSPAPPPHGEGGYQFMGLQDGGQQPIAFDPCRPIHFVVRPDNEIPGGRDLLTQAMAEVTKATGLVFRDDGPTDEAPSDRRQPLQPERYGDRWAPVLIVWSDPTESPRLEGKVAGYAGPQWISSTDKRDSSRYVTGSVVLDAPDLTRILKRKDGRAQVLAIMMHELGHLVGLDHIDDNKQLMNAENVGVKRFADGDLRGLHQLGLGACFTDG